MKEKRHLTEDQKKNLQLKLRHYLRTYRQRHDLTAGQLAEVLGWTEIHQRRYESLSPENRLVSSLDLISVFASLTDMNLGEFVNYLADQQDINKEHSSLEPWESTLLRSFRDLDLSSRSEFVHGLCGKYVEAKPRKLESLIMLISQIDEHLSEDEYMLLQVVLKYVFSRKSKPGYGHSLDDIWSMVAELGTSQSPNHC